MLRSDNNAVDEVIDKHGMLNYHVLESMADWVRVVDEKGMILYANRTMKEALGDDILGEKCYLVTGKEDKCSFCITERSIINAETVQKEEIIHGRYFSVKSSPVKNVHGEIFAAVEVFRDVTRERKLELQLVKKNKKMRKDLLFAKTIQQRILPDKGKKNNLMIDYIYQPSEMLSGDMFDVFDIDENNVGIYISDVVGHGVSASMMSIFIRETMRSIKHDILNPSTTLRQLHRRFTMLGLETDKYFTIFYGIFNKSTYEFKYSNAGHNCIPIKYNDSELETLDINGYPIALLFEDIVYDEKRIQLKKGDKILFYTDGITESKDRNGKEFGLESLINIIKTCEDNILREIEDKIIAYNWGEQDDDFALVLMEIIE